MNNCIHHKSDGNEYKYKQTNIQKLTLSSTYINRNIMVNHASECVYKLSYQPNCMRLKISFLICLTEHLLGLWLRHNAQPHNNLSCRTATIYS